MSDLDDLRCRLRDVLFCATEVDDTTLVAMVKWVLKTRYEKVAEVAGLEMLLRVEKSKIRRYREVCAALLNEVGSGSELGWWLEQDNYHESYADQLRGALDFSGIEND